MKVLRGITATVLTIIFSLFLLVSLFVFALASILAKDNVVNTIKEMDVDYAVIIENVFETKLNEEQKELFDSITEIPEMAEMFAEFVGRVTDYMIFDGELPQISEADIDRIMESEVLKEYTQLELTEYRDQVEEVALELNDMFETAVAHNKIEDASQEVDLFNGWLFSSGIREILIIALLIVISLISIVLWSWYKPLIWIGIGSAISGLLFLSLGNFIDDILLKEISNDATATLLQGAIVSKWNYVAYIAITSGIGMIVIYKLIKHRIKIENKQESTQAL